MCGRYSLTTPLESLRELFSFPESPNLQPRVNIAPTQSVPVVRAAEAGGRSLAMVRWGLVPFWAKDLSIGAHMINARAETVAETPAFRAAFAKRRCLIPADGFYEWLSVKDSTGKSKKPRKQPYRIEFDGRAPFAFAGLWESWRDKSSGETVESCSIITTDASEDLIWLHNRMPVILGPQAFDSWLAQDAAAQDLQNLLLPYAPDRGGYGSLVTYAVSPALNKPANEDLSLLDPLPEAETPRLL